MRDKWIRLLDLLDRKPRLLSFGFLIIFFTVGYKLTNHLPPWIGPFKPSLSYDSKIPFMEWAIPVYLSAPIMVLVCVHLIPYDEEGKALYRRMWVLGLMMMTFSLVVYMTFPTSYPREPVELEGFMEMMYRFYTYIDEPTNCFPSFHVSIPLYLTLAVTVVRPGSLWILLLFIWWGFIAFSTLATKQHYILDVVAGTVMATAFHRPLLYRNFWRRLRGLPPKEPKPGDPSYAETHFEQEESPND